MAMSDADLIRQIADKQEISDVLARYCRGIDRLDIELVKSSYHEDALDHHGPWDKLGRELAEDLVAYLRGSTSSVSHQLTNVLIELDGDRAWVESYFRSLSDCGNHLEDSGGRYCDRFERRAGQWKIAERTLVLEYLFKIEQPEKPEILSAFCQGSRDVNDPSYARR